MKLLISTVAAQIAAPVRETAAQALDQLSEIFPANSLQTPVQQSEENLSLLCLMLLLPAGRGACEGDCCASAGISCQGPS